MTMPVCFTWYAANRATFLISRTLGTMPDRDEPRLDASTILGHLGVMVSVAALLGVVVAGLAIPFAGAIGIGARDVSRAMEQLPEELETQDLAQKTQMVDANGKTIATLYDENRIVVPLNQISRKMVESIVAIEDYRFYQHGAMDLKGTLRALVTNQVGGGVVQGGSSITQQLVKLTLVDQAKTKAERAAATADTYERKLKELRYAIALERKYSKDWILERYLNIAYFGDGVFGVQAAARHYFNTNAKDLTYPQAAMLAGMVKNPTGYDPTNYEDRALERRNVVLDRMAQLNVIKTKKADRLKEKPLGLDIVRTNNGCNFTPAPFFCQYVVNYLEQDEDLGATAEERRNLIFSGGLTIRTTIDLRYQRAADEAVQDAVNPTDQALGALAMVEPGTGAVKALAQSRPMGERKKLGETYLNYTVPKAYGNANGFQGGSTFKAFVLASAIKQNIPLTRTYRSPEQLTLANSSFEDCNGPFASSDSHTWHNSTGSGTFDLYSGTQQSVNTFYAQLFRDTGMCEPWNLAKDMGVQLTDPDRNRVPTWVLGVTDTSPLELAEAYATFGARGVHCDSTPVTSIEDSNGKTIKKYEPDCRQVLPSAVADAVNDVLRGVQEGDGFGAQQGLGLSVTSAAKTGTINSNKAVWYMGYTPTLSTASVIAGADQLGNQITLNGQYVGGSYVSSAFGSTLAGPMWADAMQTIDDYLPQEDFVAPASTDISGVLTAIPDVAGQSVEDARATLEDAGFTTVVGYDVDSEYGEGTVAYTSPGAGESFGSGDTVTLYPSTGVAPERENGGNGNGRGEGRGNDD